MCTRLIGKTNVRYGYKVVEVLNLSYKTYSPFNTHEWIIGMNVARDAGYIIPEKGKKVYQGFFHMCANLTQAKSLINDLIPRSGHSFKIIKVRLVGDTYKGIHTASSDSTNGKVAYLSNVVFWDGSYV